MADITGSSVLRHAGDIRYRIIDDEAVVIRQEAGEVLGINSTGARLLDLTDGKTPVAQLIEILAREFDTDRRTLEADVVRFLQELREAGVVEQVAVDETIR